MKISRLSRHLTQRIFGQPKSVALRVLSTYELLENVLTFLLPKDLRASRLVSTAWFDIIQRSQTLSQTWIIRDRYLSIALLGNHGVGKKTLIREVSIGECIQRDETEHITASGHMAPAAVILFICQKPKSVSMTNFGLWTSRSYLLTREKIKHSSGSYFLIIKHM
jgi:hypothetical protein